MGANRVEEGGDVARGWTGQHILRLRWTEPSESVELPRRIRPTTFGECRPVGSYPFADHFLQQDFPFSIRIPESIPPSIALEHRGGQAPRSMIHFC